LKIYIAGSCFYSLDISIYNYDNIFMDIDMFHPFYVIIGTLAFFAVFGIVGILIEPLLRDKEQPQT